VVESPVWFADDHPMKVFLDDKQLEIEAATVAAALDAGRSAAGSLGRVIVEAKLDGRVLTAPELESPSRSAGAGTLHFVSADPSLLVEYSMRDVAGMIPDMRAAQSAAARLLQSAEYEPALTQLAEALNTWEAIRHVIDEGPRLLQIDLRTVRVGDLEAGTVVDSLARHLAALQEALRAQDWSTIADVLEGELEAAAADWQRLLVGLADRIAQSR
jgi:hypothetical protein